MFYKVIKVLNLSTVMEEDIENDATYVSLMEGNIESLDQALNQ